jgi:hypothetical protein
MQHIRTHLEGTPELVFDPSHAQDCDFGPLHLGVEEERLMQHVSCEYFVDQAYRILGSRVQVVQIGLRRDAISAVRR